MSPLQYFRLLAPEFATTDDTAVGVWLGMAEALVITDCLDAERAAMALALYAAHMLRLTPTQGGGGSVAPGPVTSEQEGDLRRTYGALKGGDTWLGQTSYGQQYLDITRVCSGLGIMTRVEPWAQ